VKHTRVAGSWLPDTDPRLWRRWRRRSGSGCAPPSASRSTPSALACISSSPATGSTQPSTLCRPRTMNITQSPTTPQPHRRHRTYIPLSLRSIAMKAVSPSPANRRPIPTSSQPLCHAVPASSSTRMPAADFASEGPRPCRHRGAQLCDGSREHEQDQSAAAGRECWLGTRTPSRGGMDPAWLTQAPIIGMRLSRYRGGRTGQVGIRPEKAAR
jgi:hypothetical protein